VARDADGTLSVPVPNARVRETYDCLAGVYGRTVAELEGPSQRRVVDRVAIPGGGTAVDVGCGPGRTLTLLADRVGSDGRVVGVDAAAGMLDEARRRVRSAGHGDRVSLVRSDARRLPLAEGAADVVTALDTLDLFERAAIDRTLRECRRVLAPEGRLCVVTMDRSDVPDSPFLRAYEWAYEHVPGFAQVGCRPIPAVEAVRAAGFEVEVLVRQRRARVWPVAGLVCSPAERNA
jgi:demethylmenaquinone methyltransferase/2-methoxy-6-polyprenyl-1,4-benzoquinol methylase